MENRIQKIAAAASFALLLIPSLASANPPRGYAKAVRTAIEAKTGMPRNQIRFRSRVDARPRLENHLGLASERRRVTFTAGRFPGTARTVNTPIGGPTQVKAIKVDWGRAPGTR